MARKNLKVDLVIVDPQNDFMGNDDGTPYQEVLKNGAVRTAALPVKGGVSDMHRVASLIDRVGRKLNDIHVTLDSHHTMHIAHPDMWVDQYGKQPGPFTMIRADDVKNDIWRPRNPNHRKRLLEYLIELEASKSHLHMIWPPHCRIGTWGHNVEAVLEESLTRWERSEMAVANYVTKGSSVWREHFGGLVAQVVDPTDPSTQLNTVLLGTLQESEMVGFAGEALTHCVQETVRQVADNIGDEHVKKLVLLTDCMSPIPQTPGGPDFPALGKAFLKEMKGRGMTLITSDEFLA